MMTSRSVAFARPEFDSLSTYGVEIEEDQEARFEAAL
jgi:hypothetical protein